MWKPSSPITFFSEHVNDDKNDFYNWVKDVFENHRLAMNIKYVKEKDEVLKHVFMSLFG